jgi:hypothetical protein
MRASEGAAKLAAERMCLEELQYKAEKTSTS